ncbi:MAG TPA: phosphomannomutase/phosphoglucomutase [bacterium]|nr:phosphomannomutase/phosphoglucomutase [bacterium]
MSVGINPTIFRAYDIRGLEGKDLTPQVAMLIGKSYSTYIQGIQKEKAKIAIGRDNRLGSERLQESFIDGLLSTGSDVIDIGLSTSPMLYFAVVKWALSGGVNVTGSHNPVGYNGFKMIRKGPNPIAETEIQELRRIIEDNAFTKGKGKFRRKEIKSEYFDFLGSEVQIQRGKIKAVIDAGNGTAGIYVPELLREIGCDVIELYCDLDGTFPNHLPDPEIEENMIDLKREVIKHKADVGLAYDGDGDRLGFVDESGHRYESEMLLLLLARDFLEKHPGEKILLDVKCSQKVIDDIKTHGGIPILWKTGHSIIKKKMREDNILLGGEISGHMFFGKSFYGFDDALLASCYLLQYISKYDKKLSEHFSDFQFLPSTPEIKVPCPDEEKFQVAQEVSKFFVAQYPNSLTIDGIRINFPEGWALVRASNTNPYLTVRIEGQSEQALQKIKKIVTEKLQEFPSVTIPKSLKLTGGTNSHED